MNYVRSFMLMAYASCVASVLAADIEDQAIAVATNRASIHTLSETDKRLVCEYLREVKKEERHLDSKGRSLQWHSAQVGLIQLGDEETMNTLVALRSSPDFGQRLVASDILLGRSQPLLIPKLIPAVRLNQWKNDRREDRHVGRSIERYSLRS